VTGVLDRLDPMYEWAKAQAPGLCASFIIALAATFLSEHYGASAMLFALLLGMAVNFLSKDSACAQGIALASRDVLRIGVALLGMRITFSQVGASGLAALAIVIVAVVATIAFGLLCARLCGFNRQFGLLTGGAVGICGASAALAIAAVLPHHEKKERAVIFTVIGVSTLSTVAMVVYPMIAASLGLDARHTGIFFGATIHDVAQVVGAGYGVSDEAGDAATLIKLLRVFTLLPVIFVTSLVMRMKTPGRGRKAPLLPGFALAFAALVAINSAGLVPAAVQHASSELSRWCLVTAMAAIGMKTQLKEVATVGLKPILMMIGETLFLMLLVIGMLAVLH
jgi:uncharacterized integral membrane protein (TIGR00698 family)